MQINTLTPDYCVTGQLGAEDILAAAKLGFATIINNRPDLEADDQPRNEDLRQIAVNAGLAYHHIPVVPGQMSIDQVSQLDMVLASAPKPVLAFCRTGNRSSILWEQTRQLARNVKTTVGPAGETS